MHNLRFLASPLAILQVTASKVVTLHLKWRYFLWILYN